MCVSRLPTESAGLMVLVQVIMLVIAYHLNAQRMGYFTKDEFLKGLAKMRSALFTSVSYATLTRI